MNRRALIAIIIGIVATAAVTAGLLIPAQTPPKQRLGLDYTPYYQRGTGPGTVVPVDQIDRDIAAIAPYFPAVRGYGCSSNLSLFYERAHAAGLETYATAWLDGGAGDETELMLLEDQIVKGNVTYAIVGSEVLHAGSLTAKELMVYIKRVQSVADQNLGEGKVVVTTADTVDALIENQRELASLERIACHIHPVWANQSPDQALDFVKEELARMEEAFGVPVDILETSYASPGPEDSYTQQDVGLFLRKLSDWSRDEEVTCFILGGWDEPWKAVESGLDFESRWGVFQEGDRIKPGNELLFSDAPLTPEAEALAQLPALLKRLDNLEAGVLSGTGGHTPPGGNDMEEQLREMRDELEELARRVAALENGGPPPEEVTLEITSVPVYGVAGNAPLEGVLTAPEGGYYLKIYVEVEGEYYIKPTLARPITRPDAQSGAFRCETNTGGNDILATGFLIEVYSPRDKLVLTEEIEREPIP